MARFGYVAVNKFGFVTKEQLKDAIREQWRQELSWPNETPEPIGKILVDKNIITPEKLDIILRETLMEPNISWGEKTNFAQSLGANKSEKQAIADYIGATLAKQPCGITVFLSNSSTVFYAFLGMVKHKVNVNVLTINAAILAAYPSLPSEIRSVTTIWKGRVDLDNALIEPPDLNDPDTKSQLDCFHGPVVHALISVTGFDCDYGPMIDNAIAREVSRQALRSGTHTCILIDHTKIRIGIEKNNPFLLFHKKEWDEIRDRGNVEVVVNCHPQIPPKQANFKPVLRDPAEIKNTLSGQNASPSAIDEVLRYHIWSMKTRDILTEIPIGIPEKGIEPELRETREHAPVFLEEGRRKHVPKLEGARQCDPNLLAFERELAKFKTMLPRLMKTHPNQFVAILNGEIVDHDEDELELTKRIYVNYPTDFVLIDEVRERAVSVSWLESPEGEP